MFSQKYKLLGGQTEFYHPRIGQTVKLLNTPIEQIDIWYSMGLLNGIIELKKTNTKK